jgi:hypothetical protein
MLTRAALPRKQNSGAPVSVVLLACVLFGSPGTVAAQARPKAAVVLFAGTAQHAMGDWKSAMNELEGRARANGLNPSRMSEVSWFAGGKVSMPMSDRVAAEVIVERVGASPEFTVVDAVGGIFGSGPATYSFETHAAATVVRVGAQLRPLPQRAAALYTGLSAGLGWVDVAFSSPNGQASGSGTGGALAASLGVQGRGRGVRPTLEVGMRLLSATPEFDQWNVSSGGGAARFVFADQADMETFLAGRSTQLGGPYLLLGLAYAF